MHIIHFPPIAERCDTFKLLELSTVFTQFSFKRSC